MHLLSQTQFGQTNNPFTILAPGSSYVSSTNGQGLITLVSNLVKFAIVLAGVYTLFNLILAGYGFLSAGGEPKNIAKAWEKIWQSLIGLIIVAGAFVLAIIFGYLIFGPSNSTILLNPIIFSP